MRATPNGAPTRWTMLNAALPRAASSWRSPDNASSSTGEVVAAKPMPWANWPANRTAVSPSAPDSANGSVPIIVATTLAATTTALLIDFGTITHFVRAGLLETDTPRLATERLFALTVLLAYHQQPDPARVAPERVRQTMTDGVRVFIRAYGAR
ncbi:hypothetical protein [Micromonospora matsumotoense]|uniref:hypothetical protein n=1 Tax=Micromonospora matsumotoense TaxID=121616 RepID=UPI0033F19DE1